MQDKNVEPTIPPQTQPIDNPANLEDGVQQGVAGQHFHMDFGFMRGSKYNVKQTNGPTLAIIDGYNSYLILVDRVTRYI